MATGDIYKSPFIWIGAGALQIVIAALWPGDKVGLIVKGPKWYYYMVGLLFIGVGGFMYMKKEKASAKVAIMPDGRPYYY